MNPIDIGGQRSKVKVTMEIYENKLVNTIETTPLHISFSVRPSVVSSVRGPCGHDRDYTVAYYFVKLGRHVNHDQKMNPIDLRGQRSKVKVTMSIYGNKIVNTIEIKPLCAS